MKDCDEILKSKRVLCLTFLKVQKISKPYVNIAWVHVFECGFDTYGEWCKKALKMIYAVFYDVRASNLIMIKMIKNKKNDSEVARLRHELLR